METARNVSAQGQKWVMLSNNLDSKKFIERELVLAIRIHLF